MKSVKANQILKVAFMVFDIPNACSKSASPNQAELPPQDSLQRSLGILTTQVLKTIPFSKGKLPLIIKISVAVLTT
jgi:hypothetical protein